MPSNQNSTYDIVLANGRVIDPETYLDAQMHVGITGDRIAAVSETPLEGKLVIDVSGLIVSPGFIDLHSHGANIPSNRLAAFDGVTTALELEYGSLPISEFYNYCAKEGFNGCQARKKRTESCLKRRRKRSHKQRGKK